jgi:FkbM family methyltransferase
MQYYSQIGQDRWVKSVLNNKRDGYFVELGACDGLHLSNTLYFERNLNWNGICIEPSDAFYKDLSINRKCNVSNCLISSYEGETVDFSHCGAVSGILDEHTGIFTTKDSVVKKTTTTLASVLDQFNAPEIIDYLSLDVEGQEYNILRTFPFDKYKFRCITVEHNAPHVGNTLQLKIRDILTRNGYTFVKGNDDVHKWGHGPIDDFYVCATI